MSSRASSVIVCLASVITHLGLGCSGGDAGPSGNGGSSQVVTSTGGLTSRGGNTGLGGTSSAGGIVGTGGNAGAGGITGTGGTSSAGGITGTGGAIRTGGTTSTAVPSSGGMSGSGGKLGTGGAGTGGAPRTGGAPGRDAAVGTGGTPDAGGDAPDGGGSICTLPMPTEGGKTYSGNNVSVTFDGVNYGIWSNGNGGTITVYPELHAFSASWNESLNFLAHAGLDYKTPKKYAELGTVIAEFSEIKSGKAGNFSMIGVYGWTQNPCVEWYIDEDSWNGLSAKGSATVTIDGATYSLSTSTTTGTGGANACGTGYSGPWTQMVSTRKGTRTCGTVTVSDHFAAWEAQGWKLGGVTSIHVNSEVGGGTGKIDFPFAKITTTGK